MRTLLSSLMNGTSLYLPVFAPPDIPGLPGFDTGEGDQLDQGQQNFDQDSYVEESGLTEADYFEDADGEQTQRAPGPAGFQRAGEITVGETDPLDEFWEDAEVELDPATGLPKQTPPNPRDADAATRAAALQVEEQAMATRMQNGLASMNLPEDVIPADFNAADPRQLRELLASVQRTTAKNTLALMFPPVQAAMKQLQDNMRMEIRNSQQGSVEKGQQEAALIRNIPAAANPKLRPVIDLAYGQALSRSKGDVKAAVIMTRKALIAMGMKIGAPATRQNQPTSRPQVTSGAAALDMFAPLPQRPQRASSQQRQTQRQLQMPNGNGAGGRR